MKLIVAIIRPERLEAVQAALNQREVFLMTVSDVRGCGRQRGYTEVYRGTEMQIRLLPKLKLEIAVNDADVEAAVEAIVHAVQSRFRVIEHSNARQRMVAPKVVERRWIEDLLPDEVQLRCFYRRSGKTLEQFTVQLEMNYKGNWAPLVRYDNAHGFCHRDTIHANGTQEKLAVYWGNLNETFTYAIEDIKRNWQVHRERYLREIQS